MFTLPTMIVDSPILSCNSLIFALYIVSHRIVYLMYLSWLCGGPFNHVGWLFAFKAIQLWSMLLTLVSSESLGCRHFHLFFCWTSLQLKLPLPVLSSMLVCTCVSVHACVCACECVCAVDTGLLREVYWLSGTYSPSEPLWPPSSWPLTFFSHHEVLCFHVLTHIPPQETLIGLAYDFAPGPSIGDGLAYELAALGTHAHPWCRAGSACQPVSHTELCGRANWPIWPFCMWAVSEVILVWLSASASVQNLHCGDPSGSQGLLLGSEEGSRVTSWECWSVPLPLRPAQSSYHAFSPITAVTCPKVPSITDGDY